MNLNPNIKKSLFTVESKDENRATENPEQKYLRRILVSGISSLILILIIVYTLPHTILSVNSLIEYAVIVALVIFLFILLVRYFTILIFAYFYLNEYTFKKNGSFSPFVSVIIPVFNEEKVILQTIKSLLTLDYSNYEIIIVNDGSSYRCKRTRI